MPDLPSNLKPRVDLEVRRRRFGEETYLIRRNEWFLLDRISDHIWIGCEEDLSLEAIATRVSCVCKLPLNEALASTIFTVARFHLYGLLEPIAGLREN